METTTNTYSIMVTFLGNHDFHIIGTTENYAALHNYFRDWLLLFAYDTHAAFVRLDDMPDTNRKRRLTTYNVDLTEDRERLRQWLLYDYKTKNKPLQRLIGALHQFLTAGDAATFEHEERIQDAMPDIAFHWFNMTCYAEQARRLHYLAEMICDNYAPRILNPPPVVDYERNRYDERNRYEVEFYRLLLTEIQHEIKRINRDVPKIIDMLVNHQSYAVTD